MPRLPVFTLLDETALTVHSARFFEECTPEWEALLEWCRFHGMEPNDMPVQQTIVRDVEHCRVVYDQIVRDGDGKVLREAVDPDHPRMLRSVVRRVHAQGETPPMPFPDVILAHLDRRPESA